MTRIQTKNSGGLDFIRDIRVIRGSTGLWFVVSVAASPRQVIRGKNEFSSEAKRFRYEFAAAPRSRERPRTDERAARPYLRRHSIVKKARTNYACPALEVNLEIQPFV